MSESATAPPHKETWLTPACEAWELRFGAGSFNCSRAAKTLHPLIKAGHTPQAVGDHLSRYLDATDKKWVKLDRFVDTYAAYDALTLTEPPVSNGWFSPELDQLTKP